MKEKKKPMRKCVVSGDRDLKINLIRIVKTKEGNISIDETGKANGKGIYIKKDKEILEKAKAKKVLERELESKELSYIYDELDKIINN